MSGCSYSDANPPPLGPEEIVKILTGHKRKTRQMGRVSAGGLSAAPDLNPEQIGADRAKKQRHSERPRTFSVELPVPPPITNPILETAREISTDQIKEATPMNMIPKSAPDAFASAPGVLRETEPAAKAARRPYVRKAKVSQAEASAAPERLPISGALSLDQEAFRIGMMIGRGEMTAFVITPDMVGQTLVFAQAPYFVGAKPPSKVMQAAAPDQMISFRRNRDYNDTILELLGDLKGEEVPLSMIAEHMISKGQYQQRSAKGGALCRLRRLSEAGLVILAEGAGEPRAWLND